MQPILNIFMLCFLLFNTHAFALSPTDCQRVPIKIEGNNIILINASSSAKLSQIYFIHNHSTQSIFVDHQQADPGASAGWATYLRPDNWSVLVLNKKNFNVHCAMIEPGKVVTLNCSQMITICQPKNMIAEKKAKGSYWLAEDKPWDQLIKTLEKKGYIPLTNTR